MLNSRILIVGQGLIGTVLAHELSQRGINPVVMDNNHRRCASNVAAGMFNPIIFKYITRSWIADELLPVMLKTYGSFENILGQKLLHQTGLVRIIGTPDEQKRWQKKGKRQEYARFIGPERAGFLERGLDRGFGNVTIPSAGWLDIRKLIGGYREYLLAENRLIEANFNHSDLKPGSPNVYHDKEYDLIIFCEGVGVDHNPFFNHLKFNHTKGEVLDVEDDLEMELPVNYGQFLIPLGNSKFRIGTTYQWNDLNEVPTDIAAEKMLRTHEDFFGSKPAVIKHMAGVRPTAADRRPFAGRHPEHPGLAILNATGSKGVMLAPWSAAQLADHLLNEHVLHPEIDLSRSI